MVARGTFLAPSSSHVRPSLKVSSHCAAFAPLKFLRPRGVTKRFDIPRRARRVLISLGFVDSHGFDQLHADKNVSGVNVLAHEGELDARTRAISSTGKVSLGSRVEAMRNRKLTRESLVLWP